MRRLALVVLLCATGAAAAPSFTFKGSGTNNGSGSTVSTGSFSTSGASLLIISVDANDNPGNLGVSSVKLGATGTENTATQKITNVRTASPNSTQSSGIWVFWSSSAVTTWIATATFATAGHFSGIHVIEATGTDSSSGNGATAAPTPPATSLTASVSLTTTVTDSKVYATCAADIGDSAGTSWTAGTNTAELKETGDATGFGEWTANNTQSTTSGNSYTVTETVGSSSLVTCTALEVLAAAGGAACTPSLTLLGVTKC